MLPKLREETRVTKKEVQMIAELIVMNLDNLWSKIQNKENHSKKMYEAKYNIIRLCNQLNENLKSELIDESE